jgi:LuxR family maltose regulon positive regulatory protein
MMETITAAATPALDHIIERPRLIARLSEGGGARVTVLAAAAGYGKTTLARQWSERQTGPVAWYRTTRASGDIALLAVQLDDLLASIAPDLRRGQPTVASIASVNASPKPLARAILRTFGTLTQEILLVVDEWEAAGTDEADELLSMLVEGLDIRFLITTRTRPSWFAPRLEVYGEGREIDMDELAMNDDEASEVLTSSGAVAGRARLMRTAEGWPAVLGLAAMTGEVDFTSSRLLSDKLYDFLASELLAAAAAATQDALMLLAVASIREVAVARSVLGPNADDVVNEAAARGLLALTERKTLSVHPLLQELLIRRFDEKTLEEREALLARWRRLLETHRWDEALSVAEIAKDPAFATEAIAAALDDLLAAGRTSSLHRWVSAARAAGAEGGLIDYAESEQLLRGDELDQALALATQATRSLEGDLAARAHLVAGRSAHLMDRPARTKAHAKSAAASAEAPETREGAQWLRIIQGIEAQSPDVVERLEQFRAGARGGLNQTLMIATANLGLAEFEGGLVDALDDAKGVLGLKTGRADPIHLTGFLSSYGYALVTSARYEEGLEKLDELISVTENYGIEFPIRFAQLNRAAALVGLRRFAPAARTLSMLERHIRDNSDGFLLGNLPIQRARLYGCTGELERALDVLSSGPSEKAICAIRGEFLGWRAVFSAVAGDSTLGKDLASGASQVGRGLEVMVLALLAEAIVAFNDGRPKTAASRLRKAIDIAVWDPFVIAIRAAPRFGAFIAEQPEFRPWLQRLLIASRDASLASAIGLRVPREAKSKGKLTPRETEVHELLAQGLTNEEIANLLYISVSTAKVHIKHIYEKLGVRSRLEAARALRDDV